MKQKTLPPKPEKVKNFCLENSCWVNVKGFEKDAQAKNHFVEEQGEIVLKILEKAFSLSDNPDLFIISPFTSVVREITSKIKEADFVKQYGSEDNKVLEWLNNKDKKKIGTVHTFQGKEADEVIFLLGCDKRATGAVRWVKSNIVNVAVTRAKYRVYFIGDKDVWEASSEVNTARQIIANEIDAGTVMRCTAQEHTVQIRQYPYTEVQLLTPNEDFFFQAVKDLCKENGFQLCPKVRMEDFVWADWKKYNLSWSQEQAARNCIKSRHIDFLICDEDLRVQGGIELDDWSHNNASAQKADEFKDNVYQEINFHCFRIEVQKYDDVDKESSMNRVRKYYQNQMKRIIKVISEEGHYCNVQREVRLLGKGYELQEHGHICPVCNGKLVLRHSSKDGSEFYGCSNYPSCRYTVSKAEFELL